MNQDSGSAVDIWYYNNQIFIHLEDSTNCFHLLPTADELGLPDVYLFEELPCVNVDPGVEPDLPIPVHCEINLEVVIFAEPGFVTLHGGLTNAELFVDEVLNGPNGVASNYRRYIRENNGNGTFSFNYILENPDGSPKLFILDKFYDPVRSADQFEDIYKSDYPCLPKDMFIYFHSGHTNVTTQSSRLQCTSSGLNSPITVSISNNSKDDIERVIRTATHEFGHYFTAGHVPYPDPNNPWPCECDLGSMYLMCPHAPGLDMDVCSWQKISKVMNELCGCLSDTHVPPCKNCFGLYSTAVPSVAKLSDDICNRASEAIVTVTIHNDCTTRNFTYVKVAYSKGAQASHDKLEITDPMDFIGGIDNTSNPQINYLIYNIPFTLGKNEKKILKCKVKLTNKGTASNPEKTLFDVYQDYGVTNVSIPTFSPTGTIDVGQLYLTDQPGSNTISSLIAAERQFNFNNCNVAQKRLKITRDLTINQDHIFTRCYVYLAEGKKIIVNPGIKLTICKSIVNSCDNFWNTIELMPGAHLVIEESSINNAEHMTTSLGGNDIEISNNSKILTCQNGITCSGAGSAAVISITDSKFDELTGYVAKIVNADNFECINSQFNNCFGGIGLYKSDAQIKGSNFFGIGNGYRGVPETTAPWKGTTIYSEGTSSVKLETIMDADPHAPKNDFVDFNCGIYNSGTSFDLQGNEMRNGEYGIYIANSSATTGAKISQNNIEVGFLGVNLDQNGIMPCTINKNDVTCTANYGTAIQIGGNSGEVLIEDNTVINETGQSGILANTCSNVEIRNNTVYTNATNGTRTDGIYLLNSMESVVSCNKLSCAFGNGTSAVEIQESPFNTVSCNEMEGADCGLVFAGTCNPNDVAENFLNNHELGLVLVTRATGGDGIIGPQYHKGNHITSCGIDKDAVNYGEPQVVVQSRFLVSPSSPYLPNNIQELVQQQWFLNPQSGNEYSCSTNNTCPGGFGARSSKSSEDYKLYNSIYNSSIGLNEFDDARTWSARKNILEYVKSKKLTTTEEQLWLKKYNSTALDLFSDIGNYCSKYFDGDGSANHRIVESYINDLNELGNLTTYEILQKKVSLIRLNYLGTKHPIEDYEVSILKDIANLCPYEYGNAVYEARMMLSSSYPMIVNEQNLCGIKDQNPAGSKIYEKNITVFPNPSNNVLQIKLNGNSEGYKYSGKVIDLFGRPVIEFSIKEILEIPVSELNPGLYLITIGSYKEANTKVLIQK